MPHEGADYCGSQATPKTSLGQPVCRETCANKIDCGVPGRRLLTYNTELDAGHISEPQVFPERSSVRAHLCDPDKPSKSVAVSVSIDVGGDRNRYLVVSIGPRVLASFDFGALQISRCWGAKCSTDRIVTLTVPDCELFCGEIDAVYLKLNCYQSLERLSRMTGFDLD